MNIENAGARTKERVFEFDNTAEELVFRAGFAFALDCLQERAAAAKPAAARALNEALQGVRNRKWLGAPL